MGGRITLQCIWSSIFLFGWLMGSRGAWPEAMKSVDAKELETALKAYKGMSQLDVDFKQVKTLKDMQLKLPSEGHLMLKPPDLVVWKVKTPQPMTVTLDKEKITIDDGTKSQTYSQSENPSAKDRESFSLLLDWLKLDAKAIASHYKISKTGDRHYIFAAKDSDHAPLKELAMDLDPSGHLTRLNFSEVSGDEILLQFGRPKVISKSAP